MDLVPNVELRFFNKMYYERIRAGNSSSGDDVVAALVHGADKLFNYTDFKKLATLEGYYFWADTADQAPPGAGV